MLNIKQFFDKRIMAAEKQDARSSEHALQLATAALLIEMTRADYEVTEEERQAVTAAVRATFELSDAETAELVRLAGQEAQQATCLHGFTNLINQRFPREQKMAVMERLWRIAYADGDVDKYEHHLLRKLAGLLHISHKDYIGAKFRARQALE